MSAGTSTGANDSRASRTFIFWVERRPKSPGIMSLMLMPTSSTPCGVNISKLGLPLSVRIGRGVVQSDKNKKLQFVKKELSEKLGIQLCYETVRKILKDEMAKLGTQRASL